MATTPIVGNPKIYTCDHCGEEYLADAPSDSQCPRCPLVNELNDLRTRMELFQAYRVESADDLEDLEVGLNVQAAAGYHAIKVDQKCDCDNPQSSGDGYVVIAARSDFDRGKYVDLLQKGDGLHAEIEAARLSVPDAMRAAQSA